MITEALQPLATPLEGLALDPANARSHNPANIQAIKDSLCRFGQRLPIVVQKQGMIVRAGNGRVIAARELAWTEIAAVIVDESNVDATAFALADNRTAELATWDDDNLRATLAALEADDVEPIGWDSKELDELVNGLGNVQVTEDETPEPPAEAVTQPGDVWELGRHRVVCGDSTKAEDVERLLNGAEPFLMVTDPPYGVDYDPQWRQDAAEKGLIAPADRSVGTVANDDRVDWTDAYRLFPGLVAYVWHADRFAADLVVNLRDSGFQIRTQVIWRKPTFAISRGHYHWQHEPCWYAVRMAPHGIQGFSLESPSEGGGNASGACSGCSSSSTVTRCPCSLCRSSLATPSR